MSDFKGGGINTTDYDSYNTKYITQKTEFTDDVYVFGKLYAEFGGDVQSFSTAGVERLRITENGNIEISTSTDTNPRYLKFNSNRANADDALGGVVGVWNGSSVAAINFKTGADTTNKDDGELQFVTHSGGTPYERLRIDSGGQIIFKPMTQTERDALTAVAGGVIYNSTTNKLQCYNGSTWNNLF